MSDMETPDGLVRSLAPLLRYGSVATLGLILIVGCATPTPAPTSTPTPAPTATPAPTPTETDREALVALYAGTGGANWFINSNWLSDAPIDEWFGVVTDASDRVTELHLYDNWLSGRIPPELGGLANLEWLGLSGNGLGGEIPPELGNLSNLERVPRRVQCA